MSFKIKYEKKFSQQDIEDVLCSAYEGGIGYWASITTTQEQKTQFDAEYSFEVPARGGEVEVFDVETNEKLGVLNKDRIRKALQMMADGQDEDGKEIPIRHFNDLQNDNADADTADVLVQLAVMGKIVFG